MEDKDLKQFDKKNVIVKFNNGGIMGGKLLQREQYAGGYFYEIIRSDGFSEYFCPSSFKWVIEDDENSAGQQAVLRRAEKESNINYLLRKFYKLVSTPVPKECVTFKDYQDYLAQKTIEMSEVFYYWVNDD